MRWLSFREQEPHERRLNATIDKETGSGCHLTRGESSELSAEAHGTGTGWIDSKMC